MSDFFFEKKASYALVKRAAFEKARTGIFCVTIKMTRMLILIKWRLRHVFAESVCSRKCRVEPRNPSALFLMARVISSTCIGGFTAELGARAFPPTLKY